MNSSELIKKLMESGVPGPNTTAKGNDLLNKLFSSGATSGLVSGAMAGSLTSLFVGKRGKKVAKSALKVGGLVAIGGLAYAAYNRYKQQPQSGVTASQGSYGSTLPTPPSGSDFLPPAEDTEAQNALGLVLIRAMIAAAKADGHIDQQEHQRILEEINRQNLNNSEKAFLLEELGKPLDIDAIVQLGVTPEIAAEIYTASLLAVEMDTPAEEAYLQMLAARLGLQPTLVHEIHTTVDSVAKA